MYTRYSRYFPATRRSTSRSDGDDNAYTLLERAGFVRSSGAAGVHYLLPLGWRVHRKICDVVFDEMELNGVLNLQMPILQQRELWEMTKRWYAYINSKTMFRTVDEHRGTEFGLAPTAEEMVTALVAGEVRSWRELPLHLHQIGPKFRDEIRPRLGLLRGREFVMSDAYSFDRDEAGMRASFDMYMDIYTKIFARVGLPDVITVQADSGAIGGSGSAEFMTLSEVGEDVLLRCEECGYGANAEKADSRYDSPPDGNNELRPSRREPTPDVTTVEQLERLFPEVKASQMIKTLIFALTDEDAGGSSELDGTAPAPDLIAVCIRGDLTVNEVKLRNLVGEPLRPASDREIHDATGAPVGFAGPIDLRGVRKIFFDRSVEGLTNFLCGVNVEEVHILDANFGRDVPVPEQLFALHVAREGHTCPECDGRLTESRGIEVGHVFMLQRGYASALGAEYTDENGEDATIWMGCYGIGTTRLLQAIAQKCHDADGLTWPASIAPFDVQVVMTQAEDEVQRSIVDEIGGTLDGMSLTALLDDRSASPGVKFKDADLIGCPLRITVGRDAANGEVELYLRKQQETRTLAVGELAAAIADVSGPALLEVQS
jgi:prolyl-tRNA synthetase